MAEKSVDRPELVVFSQYTIGGVQSYYYNLLQYDIENKFNKVWILTDDYFNNNPRPLEAYNTGYEKIFHYRSDQPLYYYLRELQQFVSNKPGLVLVNFPIDLQVMHIFRKRKKTIGFVCHDEYFVKLAEQYEFLIDFFIVHNPFFTAKLKKLLPNRAGDVYYLPYGIQLPGSCNKLNVSEPLKIIVIARMQQSKGVLDIPAIVTELKQRDISFLLTLVGDGPEKERLVKIFENHKGINFQVPNNTTALTQLINEHDIFLLPSYLDGMPVSLMETMSCGLVPVISDFNEGIQQIITPDLGYVLPKGDVAAFANAIGELNNNRSLLKELRSSVLNYAKSNFNIEERARDYYSLFERYLSLKKKIRYKYIRYVPLVDHPLMPTWLRSNYYRLKGIKNRLWKRQ